MLSVRNLSKQFVIHALDGKIIEGFRGITFDLAPGGAIALVGPSGSGKSSVLKCLYRAYLPTSGSAWFETETDGKVDLAMADEHTILKLRRREIFLVSQFLSVIPRVGALDVVAEPVVQRLGSWDAARELAAEWLARLRIPRSLFDAFPATLSGGEQQRVNIARAVIARPRLLLVDEPTASLDRASAEIVVEILQELLACGVAMVIILHDAALVRELADQVVEMNRPEESPMESPHVVR